MTRGSVAGAGIGGPTPGIALARAGVTVDLDRGSGGARPPARRARPGDRARRLPPPPRARTRAIAASAWDTGTLLHLADDHPRLAERDRRFGGYLPDDAWVHDHDAEDLTTTATSRRDSP